MDKSHVRFMGIKAIWLLTLLLTLSFHTDAFGDRTLRCKGHIVSVGDFQSDVLRKCGNPDQTESWEVNEGEVISHTLDYGRQRHKVSKLVKGPVRRERWTYNFGPQKFIRYLTFQESELIKIETGSKGYQ